MSILLVTLNARFAHASLGLRYLQANLQEYRDQAEIMELTIQQNIAEMLELIIAKNPKIIGFGVYIWNILETTRLIKEIKILRPETTIIIGGPEVSYEYEDTEIFKVSDYLITGWGDISFYELCRDLIIHNAIPNKVIIGRQPKLEQITLPYDLYTEHDLKHRTVYIEASRGCPYKCEFCLSSLDKTAWSFPLDIFLNDIETLYQRGLRQFKFVDRTFNLKREFTSRILNFFLAKLAEHPETALFLHFELVPDHLPDDLKQLILQFPAGCLQFEIGIQTLHPQTQQLISRKTDLKKAKDNISWLSQHTAVHLHVDLIAGLPAEDLATFAKGFDELWSWQPQEIQLGILKRLKGVPIIRHTAALGYKYSVDPPYAVLENNIMDFATLNHMKRVAKYWDLVANSGRFQCVLPLFLGTQPFASMWAFAQWLHQRINQTHSIALDRLFALIFEYLTEVEQHPINVVQAMMKQDFMRIGIQGWPQFLGEQPESWKNRFKDKKVGVKPKRQQQHQEH